MDYLIPVMLPACSLYLDKVIIETGLPSITTGMAVYTAMACRTSSGANQTVSIISQIVNDIEKYNSNNDKFIKRTTAVLANDIVITMKNSPTLLGINFRLVVKLTEPPLFAQIINFRILL